MRVGTVSDLFLALTISVALTFILTTLCVFGPVLSAFIRSFANTGLETGGITAVAGGVSQIFLLMLVVWLILFAILCCALRLRRRSVGRKT